MGREGGEGYQGLLKGIRGSGERIQGNWEGERQKERERERERERNRVEARSLKFERETKGQREKGEGARQQMLELATISLNGPCRSLR